MERAVIDLEANSLLDHTVIDYTASPYKLKDNFQLWCMSVRDYDNILSFKRYEGVEAIRGFFETELCKLKEIIAHNGIDYDFLVLKLLGIISYKFARKAGDMDEMNGHKLRITDSLVVSKTLNPDRYGGHSLDEWGKRVGKDKIDWRARALELGLISHHAPKGAEFQQYHPEMGDYCDRDTEVTVLAYRAMEKEAEGWDWTFSLWLEHYVREIITRQSHRGFKFDRDLAEANVRDLDAKMAELRSIVEPLLPEKPLGKTALKEFIPPKVQFKKNGEVSAVMLKWLERHSGSLTQKSDGVYATLYGKDWKLPMSQEAPVKTHGPAEITDTTFIKGWLVTLGWKPTQYKERDLTCDSKKQKLSREKFEETVERYVEQTLASPFCKDRCAELDTAPSRLRDRLLKHDIKRPLKVYTNPTITVGMEKEIDPALLELADEFPHAKLVSEYLTYAHRRNSILGGGVDPDEVDDDDEFAGKGYMAAERIQEDGRIPTPSDTCGAGTSRFKHRLVANIPRVTSLYGANMRGMFGVDTEDGFIQLGYDFDSLEAKIEAHYVYRYEGGPEYGVSLTAEKPNDCHTVLATKISKLIGRAFPRGTAKNVKYGCLPVDNTEVLTLTGWRQFKDVGVGDYVLAYHAEKDCMDWTEVTDRIFYADADVGQIGNKRWNVEGTEDHRWVAKTGYGSKAPELVYSFDLQTNSSILNAAEFDGGVSGVSPEQAAVMGWLVADGYWKWSEAEASRQNRYGAKQGLLICVGQDEKKYQSELRHDLEKAGLTWNEYQSGSMVEFRLDPGCGRGLLRACGVPFGVHKHEFDWVVWVLGLSKQARLKFLRAVHLSDGRTTVENAFEVRQNEGSLCDGIALAMLLSGMKTTVRGVGEGKIRTIRGSNTHWTGFQTGGFVPTRKTDVFCLTTKAGSFVIRQGGVLTLTGNCSYNAQPPRVAKTVGCDLDTAQVIFDAFWEQAAPLRELKEKMQRYWETTGQKKFLLGIDGRKLPIRSKGNVINTAFQSAGVICAKLAMVLHEQYLQDEGMWVDFFVDDWRNRDFCQQLIAYHDEAQLEVRRGMVKWKKFASEEECKAFKSEDGKVWSDPVHNDRGWFRGYCRAGELATIAVREAGRHFKLNVELSAGYMLGTTWASCH